MSDELMDTIRRRECSDEIGTPSEQGNVTFFDKLGSILDDVLEVKKVKSDECLLLRFNRGILDHEQKYIINFINHLKQVKNDLNIKIILLFDSTVDIISKEDYDVIENIIMKYKDVGTNE